jgi:DNA-binding response OmpR family regulator
MKNILKTIEKSVLLIIELGEVEEKLKNSLIKFKKIFLASNIEQAKEILEKESIDTVIIDLKNVNEEIEFTKKISQTFNGIIIVVTDGVDNEEILNIFRSGVDDFMPRQFDTKELERVILLAHAKRETKSLINKICVKLKLLENVITNGN